MRGLVLLLIAVLLHWAVVKVKHFVDLTLALGCVPSAQESGILALGKVWGWIEGEPKDFLSDGIIGTEGVDLLKLELEDDPLCQARVGHVDSAVALEDNIKQYNKYSGTNKREIQTAP